MDEIDKKILRVLQDDAALAMAELAERVGVSASPCWRRVQKLTADGVIARQVALLDRRRVNVAVDVFVSVRTTTHRKDWADDFARVVIAIPEVIGFYRMAGQVDYLLHIVVPDIGAYDAVYKRLISQIELHDVSAAFSMETLKSSTALPLDYL